MVRISDTGQAELNSYMATNGPVLPKGSGYGPLDTGPATKAAPRTDVPSYTPSPGGLSNSQAWTPAEIANLQAAYDYNPNLFNDWAEHDTLINNTFGMDPWQTVMPYEPPPITTQQFTDIDRYMSGVTDPFTPMRDRYAAPFFDVARDLNPATWFEPEWISPYPTWSNPDSAQTSQYIDPRYPDQREPGFWGGLAQSGPGSVVAPVVDTFFDVAQKNPLWNRETFLADDPVEREQQLDRMRGNYARAPQYLISGNAAIEDLTGFDPDTLPYGLGYVTDAINPFNITAAATAPSVPVLGSTLTGSFGKRLAGEVGIDMAARLAGEQAAGDFGESIPYFGELPPMARGLIGGLAGGIGAAGGIKAIDDVDFGAAGRSLAESNPFAAPQPGTFDLPRGAIDPTTGRPFEWQAPMGGADEGLDVPREIPMGKTADEAISPPLSPDAPQVMDARRSLLDALDEETKLRTSGVVEAEISAGRGTQAAGIRTGLQGLSSEATLDDALQAARQGASTGPLRQTTAAPLNITPEIQTQLVRDILDNPNLREFDTLRALKALDKLTQGDGLQPNEIKLLGRVFGSEVEQAAIRANAGRIPTVATLTEADLAEVARRAEVDGRGVARLEVEAMRQSELADNLLKQSRMDPTNKRLAKAAEDARARAIAKANEADRKLAESIDRANRLAEQKQARSAAAEAQKATRAEARAAEARDIKNPNYEQLIKRAEDALDKADISPALKAQQLESVRVWLKGNEAILDAYGGNAPGILRAAYAAVTGDVTDSWTSALLTREAILKSALEAQGMSPNMAKLVARRLRDAEVARRFGQTVPEYVTKSLDEAKGLPYGAEGSIGGLASISQELKNTQFGIGDLAVFGQQGLKAGTTNAPQLMAGMVNRMLAALHLPHLDTQLADTALAKRLMYQLDGVAQSSHAVTDLTAEATLFSRLGRPGAWLDRKAVIPFTRMLTDFQFNTVLTSIRNVAYEGNLVLAKMAGADISDPIVRARAAEWANAATGAGKLAQRTARAQTEKAFLLSPSMRRAQIQQIGQVARGLSSGSRVDRILAAATIASAVGSTVAVWKLLNDWIGQDEFEWDPSKPGFGNITLPGGTVINLFPQEQVAKALARSLRALVEDGITEADLKEIGKVWGNLGIGSASPGVRPMLAALGVGYDPETGYEYGGLGDGSSFAERLLKNAPIPPLGMSLLTEGFDPVRTSFEAIGVNAYEESEWQQREKRIKADPRFNGRGWSELEEWEKNLVNSEQGRVYHSDPQIKAQQERADVIAGDARDYQEKIDGWLRAGQKPDGTPYTVDDWKLDRAKADRYTAGRYDELYRDVDWKDKNLTPVDRYYQAIADRVNPETDEVDWDRVENWLKGQSWEDQAYIARNTNLRDTEMEKEYRTDVKKIADSGYFDLEEGKMQFRQENPEIAELVRKWGYSKLSVAAEDQINQYRTQQEMDDQALEAGTMDPEKWRENRKTRQAQLSAAKDAIFAALEEDGESTEALDQYFATIEANKPNGIDVDWDAVDAWVAQQPPEVQQTIDSYAGTALTPKVQEYRDAVAKIEASQYWDINDRVAQRVVEAQGGTWTEGMTADRYYGQIEAAVYQRLQERGFSALEAQSLTGVVMQDVMRPYLDIAGKVRGAMREADPELMRLLIAWGYYTPGKETTAELLASGGLR